MYRQSLCRKTTNDSLAFLLAAFCLLAAGTPVHAAEVPARAGDSIGWYTVRPGDTLTAVTVHFLGDAALWPENMRLNPQIRDPRRLQPGSRIRVIITRQLPKRNALMNRVARKVEAKPDPEPWAAAKTGDLLKENDGVRTYDRSSAELLLDDGSHVVMTENSLLFLKEMTQVKRSTHDTIEIVDGQVDLASDAKKKMPTDIELIVDNTTIKQHVAPARSGLTRSRKTKDARAQLMVYAGSTTVAAEGTTVSVPTGMGTQVAPGKAPSKPEKLLPSPRLLSPSPGATIGDGTFRWEGVNGADSYIVEVFRNASATELVRRVSGIKAMTWRSPEPLPSDDLYWRATAVGSSGLDGYPAPVAHIRGSGGVRGNVMQDNGVNASLQDTTPLPGVRLIAYRDDGNGTPDDADARVTEGRTAADGSFSLDLAPGTYWIAVDSTSIAPPALATDARPEWTWAEETFGPANSLCMSAGQVEMRAAEGPCIGGRLPASSDLPSRLSTSKHVARVTVSTEARVPLTFGFSFDVVTNVADSAEASGTRRSVQGSLRQFIRNANAIDGVNGMHFIPGVPATAGQGAKQWWRLQSVAPLPAVTGSGTILNGTAFDVADPSRPLVPVDPETATPTLEIITTDGSDGLTIAADTRLRSLAIITTGTAIRTTASLDATTVWIGLHPDGSPAAAGSNGIVAESGTLQLARVRIEGMREHAVDSGEKALLTATHLEVTSGSASGNAALRIASKQVSIDDSSIDGGTSGSRGIVLASSSGQARLTGIHIRHCSDGVMIEGGSSGNLLQRLTFEDIAGSAVLLEATSAGVPLRNKVTQCDFIGVGAFITASGGAAQSAPGECAMVEGSPNHGLASPLITSFEAVPRTLHALYGRACEGTAVEIYEGRAGARSDAHYLQASTAAYDGTFTLLVAKYDENTRMFVSATDKDGNTSAFAVSPPPKSGKKK